MQEVAMEIEPREKKRRDFNDKREKKKKKQRD